MAVISEKIVQLRKERDWSQAELGKRMGVDQRYISTWETGKNVPQFENLIKLAQVFGVSLDYLVFNNVPRSGTSSIKDFELYEYFRSADSLPEEEKKAVKQLVSAMVFRHKVKKAEEDAQKAETEEEAQIGATGKSVKQSEHPAFRKIAGKR
jgi:transcriptional regulator with XRE-family HTH domain